MCRQWGFRRWRRCTGTVGGRWCWKWVGRSCWKRKSYWRGRMNWGSRWLGVPDASPLQNVPRGTCTISVRVENPRNCPRQGWGYLAAGDLGRMRSVFQGNLAWLYLVPPGEKQGSYCWRPVCWPAVWGGCQKTLFMDDDAASMWKLRHCLRWGFRDGDLGKPPKSLGYGFWLPDRPEPSNNDAGGGSERARIANPFARPPMRA